MRSKQAERGARGHQGEDADFMKDAFDEWADNNRIGGGAEPSPCSGGALQFDEVKDIAEKMVSFYNTIEKNKEDIHSVLESNLVPAKGRETAKRIVQYMKLVGLGHFSKDKKMCDLCKATMSHVMQNKGGTMYSSALEFFKKVGEALVKVYNWLKENKSTIHVILDNKALNSKSDDIPHQVSDALRMVGLGGRVPMGMEEESVGSGKPCPVLAKAKADLMKAANSGVITRAKAISEYKKVEKMMKEQMAAKGKGGGDDDDWWGGAMKTLHRGKKIAPSQVELDYMDSVSRMNKKKPVSQTQLDYMDATSHMGGSMPVFVKPFPKNKKKHPYEEWEQIGMGKKSMKHIEEEEEEEEVHVPELETVKKVKTRKAPSARNLIVQKVMKERGIKLIEASKYVKEHGLYKK